MAPIFQIDEVFINYSWNDDILSAGSLISRNDILSAVHTQTNVVWDCTCICIEELMIKKLQFTFYCIEYISSTITPHFVIRIVSVPCYPVRESTFQMENRINEEVVKKRAVKFYLSLHVNFHLSTDVALLTDPPVVLSADTIEVYDSSDVHDALNSTYENLVSAIEDFQQRGSGWILDKLIALDLHLLEFDPLRATSYIPLTPTCIQNRKAVINIKNEEEKCFLWFVIAGLYRDTHAENHDRLSQYLEYEKEFNLQGVQFAMALNDIPKFERLNIVSVSVYAWSQEGFIYPLKVSKEVNERHVNLFLIDDDDTNHYCFIKDFDKLVGSQYSSANHKTYFCRFCFHGFSSHSATRGKAQHRRTNEDMEKRLKEHEERCFAFCWPTN